VALHVGARPVLVDTWPGSPHISAGAVEKALTPHTKAVIPVDIAGIPADYDAILDVLERAKGFFEPGNELQAAIARPAIVADCAHSFGATYRGNTTALMGDIACFSFHAVKNLTTAEGGAAVFGGLGGLDADEIYRKLSLLSLHGQSKDALAKERAGSWEYDIFVPGYKCNMTDIAAALGLSQLERYDAMLARRKVLCGVYDAIFKETRVRPLSHQGKDFLSSRHLYMVSLDGVNLAERNAVIAKLAEREVAANVHYKPLPLMTAYKKLGFNADDYPNAMGFFINELTLPLNTCLSDEQAAFAARALLESLEEVSPC
jgi:dTDP-4-amino-4,6-dideoxygalactose transaminase